MRNKNEILESHIYTNDDYSLYERFRDLLSGIASGDANLDSLVGYFRSSGYFPLAESLKGLRKIRIIIGINADPLSAGWYRQAKEKREALVREAAYREICQGIEAQGYRREVEAGLKLFVEDVLSGRLEMRAYDRRVVHAKFYLFTQEGWSPGAPKFAYLITGSSNFTGPGLGIAAEEGRRNYELNLETTESRAIGFAHSEFERLWGESSELIPVELAEAVRSRAFIASSIRPSDFYYRFLYEVFRDQVDYEGKGIEGFFPSGYKRLSYQIDAVNEGLGILERHRGFFLADVVGLGKTVVATVLLLRWFSSQDKGAKALIVAPPVLMDNWEKTFASFQVPAKKFRIVSSGSLHKVSDPEGYAMVIVDEAHNFRNSKTEAYARLERICKEGGELGRKNVILVSATPVNNEPLEILNLINLFQDTRASSLGVTDLTTFFQDKQGRFVEAKRRGTSRSEAHEEVKLIYEEIRNLVLADITIRRTRSDLLDNELYKKDLIDQGISFPKVQDPRSIGYFLDSDVDTLFDDTLEALTRGLAYAYHRRLHYLRGKARERFDIPENTFVQLADLLRRFFMKRLDSSFEAFRSSLHNFGRDNSSLLSMYRQGRIYYSNSISVSDFVGNEDLDGLLFALETQRATDPSISEFLPSDFDPSFERDLVSDSAVLSSLIERWDAVAEDPKFDEFAGHLDTWLREGSNPGRRLVVFSESEDTVRMLEKRLADLGRKDVLAVSAEDRDGKELAIRSNFDANYPAAAKEDRYRILIATDVLAEGVNLHRANTIVNYDTPWNSVRMFQRVGRVNRVGSIADKVFIYNFFPLARVEDQIELKKKAEMKLQAFHSAFGEDAAIYSPLEEVGHFGLYGGKGMEDEGPSPKLRLLLDLRRLKEEEPTRYEKILALPPALRCVRESAGSTPASFVHFATERSDIFYLRRGSGTFNPISLIEAASLLAATEEEKGLDVEVAWESEIDAARIVHTRMEESRREDETRVRSFSREENRALLCLQGFMAGFGAELAGLGEGESRLFAKAIDLIRAGAATKSLVRVINESERNSGHVADEALALHLAVILRSYGIEAMELPETARPGSLRATTEPIRFVMAETWTQSKKEKT